ncbi:MAG: RHS repeat-associated core domain-containing protein [Candidatus Acidiferrales bacterium]
MVEQNNAGTYTQIVYDPLGEKFGLMNAQTLKKAFAPLPDGGIAAYTSSGLAYYRHPDWLGSSRLASTQTRTIYSDTAYAPFGEPYAQSGTADPSFTGQNQDTASNLYDFLYREHSPIQGRWISPDPAGLAAVSLTDPQSWNRYAYVRNSPLFLVDQWGLCDEQDEPGASSDTSVEVIGHPPCFYVDDGALFNPGIPLIFGEGITGGSVHPSGGSGVPTIGPAPEPQKSTCVVRDPIFSGLEYTGKAGPEVQLGPLTAGLSFYDNFTTGQGGAKGELNLGVLSIEGNVPTPPGGSLTGNQGTQWTISFFGFQKNLTTGGPWEFSPSQTFGKLGLQVLFGGEVSLNTKTMNQQAKANEACIAKGGG